MLDHYTISQDINYGITNLLTTEHTIAGSINDH